VADRKIIAVVGATGAQGVGPARAITHDPDSGIARSLDPELQRSDQWLARDKSRIPV
jgi:hypothetical protein